jgi:hypothetical protein
MADPILVLFSPRFTGEQSRELLVKVDQVLGVLPSLKFILYPRSDFDIQQNKSHRLTVFSSEMSAQPFRT